MRTCRPTRSPFAALSRHAGAAFALALAPALPPLVSAAPPPTAELTAVGSVRHDALDRLGETLGAFGSGLAYDPRADRWLAVADRGPGDGAIDFRPRFQTLRVERPLGGGGTRLAITVEATTLFQDAEGHPFAGHSPDSANDDFVPRFEGRVSFDPESIALAPDGTLYVGEEYGPFVCQFDRAGHFLRRLVPPEAYLPRDAAGRPAFGDDAVTGRAPNHGFEGLAISPDGARLTALLQGPLLQDGGRKGSLTRLLVFDAATGQPCAEYAYAFESAQTASDRLGLTGEDRLKKHELQGCELVAVDAHRFLVLERDGRGRDGTEHPQAAAAKAVWLVDLAGATDLLAHPPAAAPLEPSDALILPQKTLVIDLAGSPWRKLAPEWTGLNAKWEGLALRPRGGGEYSLLVSSDNDFLTPTLHLQGHTVPFPKARQPVDTQLLLYNLFLPVAP